MILKALKYGTSNWSIASGTTHDDFVEFENINLIVGRNASGKTRLIESLRWISDILDSKINAQLGVYNSPESLSFELVFKNNEDLMEYILVTNTTKDNDYEVDWINILDEKLFVNKQNKLDRKAGKLYYEQLEGTLEFKVDNNHLAIERGDDRQQPFFKILHDWGRNLSHYSFGGNMGKGIFSESPTFSGKLTFKNSNNVKQIFSKGESEFMEIFKQNVIEDMRRIDYILDDIFTTDDKIKTSLKILYVKESDLEKNTFFEEMSQGMARAFSLIVQLNYSLMAKIPSCILIDDIGEGLDYERSKSLIDLIIKKVEGSNIQLFMTTNDRFVMNSVPLKYWSVIHREGSKSVFYNYQNSKQTFDDFAFTGLNNFDFFATDFYRQGFEEFIATAQ
jgi:AAA15 family ATPase/GTPase